MHDEKRISSLSQSDLFKHLKREDFSILERITTITSCSAGHILYRPGEAARSCFLLRSGQIQLYHLSTDGRKLITATFHTGSCFGELSLLGQERYSCFAEAIEASQLYMLNTTDLERFLMDRPETLYVFLRIVGQRFVQLETQLVDTAFRSTPARLATLLLQLAHASEDPAQSLVVEGFSHEELAERLGVYRETVSAALRELREAGAILPGRKRIMIKKPTALQAIAMGTP